MSLKDPFCAKCKKSGDLLTCTRCKVVKYCDRKCQQEDFKSHKKLCLAIADPEVNKGQKLKAYYKEATRSDRSS